MREDGDFMSSIFNSEYITFEYYKAQLLDDICGF